MYEVIIPARNAASTLELTLTSLKRQSMRPLTITVIDDGSEDGTAAIARAAGVRVLRTTGLGVALAQNLGLRHVTAPAVAFVDADDAWTSEAGERLNEALSSNAGLGAVSGAARTFDQDTPHKNILDECTSARFGALVLDLVEPRDLWRRNVATKSATMFRTAMMRDLGGYRPLISGEDYDLLLRATSSGWRVGLAEEVICWRMTSAGTMTANSQRMLLGELEALRSFHSSPFCSQELGRVNLRQREARAWLRALARDARFHGSLAESPPPPAMGRLAPSVQRWLASSPGDHLARSWKSFANWRDGQRGL